MLTIITGAGADVVVEVVESDGADVGGLVAIVFPFTSSTVPDTLADPMPGVPGACLLVTGLVPARDVIETDVAGVAIAVVVTADSPPMLTDDKLVEETGDSHCRGAGESSPPPMVPVPDILLVLGVPFEYDEGAFEGGITPVNEDVNPTEEPDPGLDPLSANAAGASMCMMVTISCRIATLVTRASRPDTSMTSMTSLQVTEHCPDKRPHRPHRRHRGV